MAVDADPGTEGIDTSASRVVAEEFEVSTNITAAGTPYSSYKMSIEYDDDILAFVPVEPPMNVRYTGLGNMTLDVAALVKDDDSDGRPEIFGGSARYAGTSQAVGPANYVRFRCTAPGTTSLHLLTSSESADPYTTMVDTLANFITTTLQDATITCSSGTASPTPTATALPAVGGIAELPALSGASGVHPTAPTETFRRPASGHAMVAAAGGIAGALAVAAVVWYVSRPHT